MFKNGITEEQIIANMRDDFLEDAAKRLELLRESRAAARVGDCSTDPFGAFRAEVHTMKGMGQAFGFPSLTIISRRLEGYIHDYSPETFANDDDVDLFIDRIAAVIDAREEPSEENLEAMIESLPLPPA